MNYEAIENYYDNLKNKVKEEKEEAIKLELQKNALELSKQKVSNNGSAYGGTYTDIYNQKKLNMQDNLSVTNKKYDQVEDDLQNKYIEEAKKAFNKAESNRFSSFSGVLGQVSKWASKLIV